MSLLPCNSVVWLHGLSVSIGVGHVLVGVVVGAGMRGVHFHASWH